MGAKVTNQKQEFFYLFLPWPIELRTFQSRVHRLAIWAITPLWWAFLTFTLTLFLLPLSAFAKEFFYFGLFNLHGPAYSNYISPLYLPDCRNQFDLGLVYTSLIFKSCFWFFFPVLSSFHMSPLGALLWHTVPYLSWLLSTHVIGLICSGLCIPFR